MFIVLGQIFHIGLAQILQVIISYSYIAIFILMFGESTFLPIPGELVLPFVGYLMVIGAIDPVLGFADAVVAALAGSIVNYLIGYFFGLDVVLKYGKRMGFRMKHYKWGIKWMKTYGVYFAFISKLLPVVRSAASIICGALEMDFKSFVIYTSAGIMVWSAVLISAGYVLADNWNQIYTLVSSLWVYFLVALGVAALAYTIYILIMNRYSKGSKKKGAKR